LPETSLQLGKLRLGRLVVFKSPTSDSLWSFSTARVPAGGRSKAESNLPWPSRYTSRAGVPWKPTPVDHSYLSSEPLSRVVKCPDAIQPIRAALCRDSCTHLPRPRRSGRLAVKGFWLHHPSPHRQSPRPDESRRWLHHHRRRQHDTQQLAHRSGSHRRC
jgi:hypothetical protein